MMGYVFVPLIAACYNYLRLMCLAGNKYPVRDDIFVENWLTATFPARNPNIPYLTALRSGAGRFFYKYEAPYGA